ncbi:MAG TPA: dienelactone hydrolase family protein [Candidatus Limnocylindria bacterium]|nr:dienelactone hydrolase family protein [Candidatus Limnocylindria bacterium]
MYRGMHCEVVSLAGHNGDQIEAYHARALGDGPHPSVVVIHHMPGWDDWTLEVARRITHHGYATLSPHLYSRSGPGDPDDVAAKARAAGGVSDDQVMGDITASAAYLRAQTGANGKVGVIGFCSGGRQAYLAACRIRDLDAAVDCWGGAVVVDDPAQLDEKHPVAPIDLTAQMSAPLLGIFGNDDRNPTAAQVDRTEAELKRHSKTYEFHRYDGAGHAFFHWGRPEAYRGEQAIDAWSHVFAFFARHLGA